MSAAARYPASLRMAVPARRAAGVMSWGSKPADRRMSLHKLSLDALERLVDSEYMAAVQAFTAAALPEEEAAVAVGLLLFLWVVLNWMDGCINK